MTSDFLAAHSIQEYVCSCACIKLIIEMFHTRLNNFPVFRNFCIELNGRSCNKYSNLNELKFDLNFVKLKLRIFKRHFSSYWPNVGVRDFGKQ